MGDKDAKGRASGGSPPGREESGGRGQVVGGYRLIPVREIAAVWLLHRADRLRTLDLRAYLACHEAISRRCSLPKGTPSKFTLAEIRALTGGTEPRLRAALRRLEAAGVLTFRESEIRFERDLGKLALDPMALRSFLERFPNHDRLLPVPRRMLRLLAGGARISLLATVLGHLIWGLYQPIARGGQGGFRARGRVKCSWIAETFGIDLRRVKGARRELIELGWLFPEQSKQWQLNRHGAAFQINLAWSRSGSGPAETSDTKLPPPPAQIRTESPPPESNKELPNGRYKNQEPASGGPAGVKTSETKKSRGEDFSGKTASSQGPSSEKTKPTLRNIVAADLREVPRLLELHAQAVESGLLGASESERLKFVAAAEHARVIGTTNPCGLFSRLVRSKLWHYLTQDDEDAANRRLKASLFGKPQAPTVALAAGPLAPLFASALPEATKKPRPSLSDDARFVRDVTRQLITRGIPESSVWRLVSRERPEWTRKRWDEAVSELEGSGKNL